MGELLVRMSSEELTQWQAYERVTGTLGQERDDQLAALVAERVTNSISSPKKGSKRPEMKDFIPQWDPKDRSNSPDEMKKRLKMMNARFGGTWS